MPELDFRDIRADEVSLGDLLDFDTLMRTFTDAQRTTINRKIAHEVCRKSGGSHRIEELEGDVAELRAEVAQLRREKSDAEAGRKALSDAAARHTIELADAEQRGYERGLKDGRERAA